MSLITAICLITNRTEASNDYPKDWVSKHFLDHPLIGKVVDHSGRKLKPSELAAAVKEHEGHLLLGEVHDNPDHHLLQAWLIGKAENQRSIVFEMVPARLNGVLKAANENTAVDLNRLSKDLEWEARGWYSWRIYRPVFEISIAKRLRMLAGNLNRDRIRAISRQGPSALLEREQQELGLSTPLPKTAQENLEQEMGASHCGLMPETAWASMAVVQRARDGAMARQMNIQNSPSVLIAGSGPVRKDRGVPFVLDRMNNQAMPNLSIAMMEVAPNQLKVTDYRLNNDNGAPLFDYVIFTPKFDTTDHCAQLREQMKTSGNNLSE